MDVGIWNFENIENFRYFLPKRWYGLGLHNLSKVNGITKTLVPGSTAFCTTIGRGAFVIAVVTDYEFPEDDNLETQISVLNINKTDRSLLEFANRVCNMENKHTYFSKQGRSLSQMAKWDLPLIPSTFQIQPSVGRLSCLFLNLGFETHACNTS